MDAQHEIIAGESFGVTLQAFRSDEGACLAASLPAEGCPPFDLRDIRIDCLLTTTPLGDRLAGSTSGGERDFAVTVREAIVHEAFFNISEALSARLSPGPLHLSVTFRADGWTDIAETEIGTIVKRK